MRKLIALVILALVCPAQAQYSGGSGTGEDPYQIATAADLILLGETPEDYDKHFILTADIDLDPNLPGRKVFDKAVIAPDLNDTYATYQGTDFTGVFDGNNHTISHLTITGWDYLGLFGLFGNNAEVSNLGLEALNVNGNDAVGGLVGYNTGRITMSYSTGTVAGESDVGGLVGCNCCSITMSWSTGTVTGSGRNVGGLVGDNKESITASYSTGMVTGNNEIGGLVGRNGGSIAACYSTGMVTGSSDVGGLVGSSEDIRNISITSLSFWDTETSGQAISAEGSGLTTAEMQDINTYLSEGWDFVDEVLNGTCDYWQISPGDYPRLHFRADNGPVMPEGLGTAEQPYLIRDARDLGTVWFKPLAHYRMEASVDLSGITWCMAVIPLFDGTFEGNGHVIRNLHIQGGGPLGLFGLLGNNAEVSNLGLEAVDINGVGDPVGGLVGRNKGTITMSYSTGSVTGRRNVGDLVGFNSGSITMSYSTGSVTGGQSVGGLVGGNEYTGHITSSYSNASVNGVGWVGGLVGWTEGFIISCYSTGSVSGSELVGGLVGFDDGSIMLTSSFWDMETSGQATSAGGFGVLGLTTVEMMDPEILGLNGLLTNDPNWVLDAGRDYPRLAWEGTPGQVIPEPVIDWLDGQGTEEVPYRIDTADQLIRLSRASVLWDKDFILGADIDLDPNLPGRRVFSQAVIQSFSGVFEGNGHTISHLTISGGSGLGLFGSLNSGATTSNLGLEAVDIDGVRFVGGLAGGNSGSIINCYSKGTVSGEEYAGGLVGSNYGSIINCYVTGTVSANEDVGGLVGTNGGSIATSYSTASIHGGSSVGGLAGRNSGSITSSLWDMETSGIIVSDGGIGLTTAEMMDPYILGLAGFANDPNWVLDAGCDYPRLAWEGTTGQVIPEPVIDWLDGQGTEQEPYRVDTADQLILLGKASILWDKHLALGADIDLDPSLPGRQVFSQALIEVFYGAFDGNGHAISRLTITGETNLGLFRELAPGAAVSNLGLEAVDVNGTGDCVAGLVGSNNGNITNCYSTGMVKGSRYVGGLVGNNSGSITDSYTTGLVTGDFEVGGLVGVHDGDSITSCNSNSSVNGDTFVGGLVGTNDGPVTDSYSTGSVSGDSRVGGLVGQNDRDGSITMSYSTSAVDGNSDVGGLVGGNLGTGNTDYDGIITRSYSSGPVTGGDAVGGLVGANAGRVSDCYCTGTVAGRRRVGGLVGYNGGDITDSYSTGRVTGDSYVAGHVGLNFGSITSSFWDIQTSGKTSSAAGMGRTTTQMQTASTFLDAGWDLVNETMNGTDDIWSILEGRGYPRLWWEKLYVDDDAPGDPGPDDPLFSDPLENGSRAHPFDTIREAIDFAPARLTVLVQPGQYLTSDPWVSESIRFLGKNIVLSSTEPTNPHVAMNTVIRGAVLFTGTEDPNCTLAGFKIHSLGYGGIAGNHTRATISHCIISGNGPCGGTVMKDCDGTISNCLITDNTTFFSCGTFPVIFGCDGLIKNCTIADNISGIVVGTARIENCIIYNNKGPQVGVSSGGTASISYSDIQGGLNGITGEGAVDWGLGNMDIDPGFVRLGYWVNEPLELIEGDYHLRSEGWRWNQEGKSWTYDYMTSPCVDAGNPETPLGEELMAVPRDPYNEYGVNVRINMGAYGGTVQASMPPCGWAPPADVDNNGTVDSLDLSE